MPIDPVLSFPPLDRTAALVWRACDGRRTVAGISAQLGRELGVPADEPLVRLALQRLREAHLLEPGTHEAETLTRRQVARQAVLLPVVVSLLAPKPTEAATCNASTCPGGVCTCNGSTGSSCWNGTDCSSYVCCSGSFCSGCFSGTPVPPCYP